jgi:hypothetical protein
MRIVFTAYAINASTICLILTLALMVCDEYSDIFDVFVNYVVEYIFIVFGPCMTVLCIIGISRLPANNLCSMSHVGYRLNYVDIFILLVCLLIGSLVTFYYAVHKTNVNAEECL